MNSVAAKVKSALTKQHYVHVLLPNRYFRDHLLI